jgi:LPXTG-motif cell wall-anchored protein
MSIKTFKRASLSLLFVGLLGVALTPRIHADEWNKQTKVTFSEDVQVPGKVLPAGTYTFRLLDSSSERHVVQIFDESGRHLITTVIAIPNYRLEPKGRTVMKFEESPVGQPEPLKAWFYPGDNFGQEFVYKKGEVLETASVTPAAAPVETAQNTPPAEPVPAEATPALAPVEPEPAVAAPMDETPQQAAPQPDETPAATPAPVDTTPDTSQDNDNDNKLPKTGSEMPLIGLLGIGSLGAGLAVGKLRRLVA